MTTTAWYILDSQRWWAKWVNVLHLPYTGWHLSYVVIGASLADTISWTLLGWTLLAFLLGMGIASHCFDLLQGDPLRLKLPRTQLGVVGFGALGVAVSIGLSQWALGNVPIIAIVFIALGIVFAIGYNLEWPGLHGNWQFATWWGVFPLIVGYLAQGLDFSPALIPAVVFAFTSAYAQRVFSTRARLLRRQTLTDDLSAGKTWMLEPLDGGLTWLSIMMVALAVTLAAYRTIGG